MASTSARLVTSAATDRARAPLRWSSVATGRATSMSTSLTTTVAPSRANRRAVASPIPLPAPVTSATRPSSRMPPPGFKAPLRRPRRAGSRRDRRARWRSSEARRPVEVAADDHAKDLARAPAPQEEARVAEVALHGVLGREGVGREDPGGLVADPVRGLGGEELGHRSLPGDRAPLVDGPRRVVHEQARRVELGEHVDEPEGHRLVLADGLAERDALLRVAKRGVVGRPAEADREGPGHHPDLRQDAPHLLDPARLAAEEVLVGNDHVVEDDLAGGRRPHAELLDLLAERHAGKLPVDQEERDVLHPALGGRLRADRQHVGDGGVRDPRLGPLETPAAVDPLRRGGEIADVRARVRLGQGERGDLLAAKRGTR